MYDHELDRRFTYHRPTGDQPKRYESIRDLGRQFAELIDGITEDSREKSLAITNVEQAVMWANAAIAREGRQRFPGPVPGGGAGFHPPGTVAFTSGGGGGGGSSAGATGATGGPGIARPGGGSGGG